MTILIILNFIQLLLLFTLVFHFIGKRVKEVDQALESLLVSSEDRPAQIQGPTAKEYRVERDGDVVYKGNQIIDARAAYKDASRYGSVSMLRDGKVIREHRV